MLKWPRQHNEPYGLVLLLLLLLCITNLPPQWDRLPCDCAAYQAIADAAPGVPTGLMRYHWAQRYTLPLLIGLAAKGSGLAQETVFTLTAYGLTVGVVLLYVGLPRRLVRNHTLAFLSTIMLIFNPYMFRYYLTLPPMLTDLFFTFGLAILLHALLRPSLLYALLGVVIMGSARQTTLLCIPPLLLFIFAGARFRGHPLGHRVTFALATVIPALFLYWLTGWTASAFAGESYNLIHVTGIVPWFAEHYDTVQLADFVLRFVIMFVMPAALFLPLLWVRRRRLAALAREAVDPRGLQFSEPLLLLLFAGAILAQPVLAGPGWAIDSVQRYCGMGMIPFLLGLLMLVEASGGAGWLDDTPLLSLLVLGLGFSSLHHSFTFLGPADDRKAHFVLLHFLVAALLFVAVTVRLSRRDTAAVPSDHESDSI